MQIRENPLLERCRETLDAFGCAIFTMRYENVELAKVSINFCLVASITVANVLAELSDRSTQTGPRSSLPCVSIGASEPVPISILAWASPEATRARSADRARSRQGKGTDVGVVQAWIGNSHHERNWYWRVHEGRLLRTKAMRRIGLLGVAYKEDTQSTKNSAALAFSRDCVQIQLFLSPSCLTPWIVPIR